MEEKIEVTDPNAAQPNNYQITLKDHRIYQMVYFILGVIEVLLGFRFILKLLGANPETAFAAVIYALSSVFIFPFTGLFAKSTIPDPVTVTREFEPHVFIAMIFYAVLALGIAKLILIIRSKPTVDKK